MTIGIDARHAINPSIRFRVPLVWEALPWRERPLFTPSAAQGPIWEVREPLDLPGQIPNLSVLFTGPETCPVAAVARLHRTPWRWGQGEIFYLYVAQDDARAHGQLALLALASALVNRLAELARC